MTGTARQSIVTALLLCGCEGRYWSAADIASDQPDIFDPKPTKRLRIFEAGVEGQADSSQKIVTTSSWLKASGRVAEFDTTGKFDPTEKVTPTPSGPAAEGPAHEVAKIRKPSAA